MVGDRVRIKKLKWHEASLGEMSLPKGRLHLTLGLGSGLTRRPGDDSGRVWAVTDRGPNLRVDVAVERYGLTKLAALRSLAGAKVMPRPELGPELVELKLEGDAVRLVARRPLKTAEGAKFSGLPLPGGVESGMEPVFDLEGRALGTDRLGADTEAVAALPDGSFWISEEYGPSLLKVDAKGVVSERWVPVGRARALSRPDVKVRGVLPAIALRRKLNRGFEALAASPNGRWLYAGFQSALVRDEAKPADFVRVWKIDAATARVAAQFLYPFDSAKSFARDQAAGKVSRHDLKVCEFVCMGEDELVVLERISQTMKLYAVKLHAHLATPAEHLDAKESPALEDMTKAARKAAGVRMLEKRLLLSSDEATEIGPDIEGVTALSERELLIVSDNDYGVEGVATGFWRLKFSEPLFKP